MYHLITNPDRHFRTTTESESIRLPFTIVLCAALSTLPGSVILMTYMSEALPTQTTSVVWLGILIGGAGSVAIGLLLWIVYSGVLFTISTRFDGTGDFRILLRFTGYTYVPLILAGLVDSLVIVQAVDAIGPVTNIESAEVATKQIRSLPSVQTTSLLRGLFVIWQGSLLVFALKHARKLTTRNALYTASIPVTMQVATQLWAVV